MVRQNMGTTTELASLKACGSKTFQEFEVKIKKIGHNRLYLRGHFAPGRSNAHYLSYWIHSVVRQRGKSNRHWRTTVRLFKGLK